MVGGEKIGGTKRPLAVWSAWAVAAALLALVGCSGQRPVAPETPRQAVGSAYAAVELVAAETRILVDAGKLTQEQGRGVRDVLVIALDYVDEARRIEASGGTAADVERLLGKARLQLAIARARMGADDVEKE